MRNIVVYRSPVPYAQIDFGPIRFDQKLDAVGGESLVATLDQWSSVRSYYVESISASFGPFWFVVVTIALVGGSAAIVCFSDWRFVAAVAAVVGILTYPFLPITGGLPFVNNLRYVVPALMLAVVVAALVCARSAAMHVALAAACAAGITANLTADHRGRIPAWPGYPLWGLLAAIAIMSGSLVVLMQRDIASTLFRGSGKVLRAPLPV